MTFSRPTPFTIAAIVLLAVIGGAMCLVLILTYLRITSTFEPLHPQGELEFATPPPFFFHRGDQVTLIRTYCNDESEDLIGGLSTTFVEESTNTQVPGGGLSAVYPPGCHAHSVLTTIPKDLKPGTWRAIRSIIVLKGDKFQQVTSRSPEFQVSE